MRHNQHTVRTVLTVAATLVGGFVAGFVLASMLSQWLLELMNHV